jgi:hypothetical protein
MPHGGGEGGQLPRQGEWLRLAADWLKLAQEAERHAGRWFRT